MKAAWAGSSQAREGRGRWSQALAGASLEWVTLSETFNLSDSGGGHDWPSSCWLLLTGLRLCHSLRLVVAGWGRSWGSPAKSTTGDLLWLKLVMFSMQAVI